MTPDDELRNRYTYHIPSTAQVNRFEQIRFAALEFARLVNRLCPDSDEKSRAFDALDDVVFNANASIARNG